MPVEKMPFPKKSPPKKKKPQLKGTSAVKERNVVVASNKSGPNKRAISVVKGKEQQEKVNYIRGYKKDPVVRKRGTSVTEKPTGGANTAPRPTAAQKARRRSGKE
jgi:hypothetical protein